MKPVVVLAAHTMGYGVIRSLSKKKIPIIAAYYDKEDFGYVSKYINKAVRIPNPQEDADGCLQSIIELSKELKGGLLIPTNDDTLEIVSKNKNLLSDYFIVATNDWYITEQILNKKLTYQIASFLNIDIPQTIFPVNSKEIEEFFNNLNSPVIIKPCISHTFYNTFAKKFFNGDSYDELNKHFEYLQKNKFEVMIQELIESKDSDMVMYNAYSIHGKPFLELTAQKIRNGPAVYGNSTVSKSKNIEEIILPSRKILEYIGYTGYCCIEYRRDLSDNRFKFLEINGRYNLSNYLLNGCGYNAPWMEYKYYLFNEIPSNSISFKENIYWIDIFRDLSYSLPRVIKGQISFTDYLRPYFSKHVFAILDFKDILPFLKRGFSILGNFLKNVNKSLAYKDKNR